MCSPMRTRIGPDASACVISSAAASAPGAVEGHEERVALRVDLDAVVTGARFADHAPVLGERVGVPLGRRAHARASSSPRRR